MTRRARALVAVWTLPSAMFLALAAIVFGAYRIPPPHRLDARERAAVMATLRAALTGAPATPCPVTRPGGPVAATVWVGGRSVLRVDGAGATLGAAVDHAASLLAAHPRLVGLDAEARSEARIQVDVIVGRAPLGGGHWLGALALPELRDLLAIQPGVDGVGAEIGATLALLLPHELTTLRVLSTRRPSEAVPDLALGVDLTRIATALGTRAGSARPLAVDQLFRFRSDTFVEAPAQARGSETIPLVRGMPAAPSLSGAALRSAALAGGRYLVRHLAPNGRYVYEHDLGTGRMTDPARSSAYSMPRHAGTTYFLAELYRITREEWLREPIERAFAHLAELAGNGRCATRVPGFGEVDCVIDRGEAVAQLGSTALTVVALAEYQRATGDRRYLAMASRLAAFLLYMQRDDGSFRHLYDPKERRYDDRTEMLYFSGEAALALARMHAITGDERYARAAERALDWLVGWYDFFLGGFFYGEEHWTCIAAEALWPWSQRPRYREFCDGYGAFLRAQQPRKGDVPDGDDLAGAYNVTPFVAPYNTPAGSRTEAMISAYLLGVRHGRGDPDIRAQIRAALQYTLGQQIRVDSAFDVIGEGVGGMPGSPIDRTVRIDYVQHVCSAMIRASEWIDSVPR